MLANQSSLKNSPDPLLCGPGEFFIITTRVYGIHYRKQAIMLSIGMWLRTNKQCR